MRNAGVIAVGFTGTASGMTEAQTARVAVALELARIAGAVTFHHGCCIGADEQAARLAKDIGFILVGYPGKRRESRMRSLVRNDVEMAVAPPLERNWQIVADCSRLIAAPHHLTEVLRSGTWATVRYAEKAGLPALIVWPNGTTGTDRRVPMVEPETIHA